MKTRFVLILAWLLIVLLNSIVWLYLFVTILFNIDRAISITIAYDRLGNTVMGQGDKETISSWSGKKNSWQEEFVNWLFFHLTGEVNHCGNNREN